MHDDLCPQAQSTENACVCTIIAAARKDAKNQLLHFFANEIMKLFLSERGR